MRSPALTPAAALLMGAALLTATAGCGAADPPRVRAPLTSIARSRAHSVAPLLTIRAADLPEFKVTAHPAAAQKDFAGRRFAGCVRLPASRGASASGRSSDARGASRGASSRLSSSRGASGRRASSRLSSGRGASSTHRSAPSLRPWASAHSEQLSANSGYQTLGASSYVAIMPSPAAARAIADAASYLDPTCTEHALRAALARAQPPVRGVVFEPLSTTVNGADASSAYRVVLGYRSVQLVAYMDLVFFSYGQDAITLSTYHASKPVPPAMDERLLGLLVARAKSHSR